MNACSLRKVCGIALYSLVSIHKLLSGDRVQLNSKYFLFTKATTRFIFKFDMSKWIVFIVIPTHAVVDFVNSLSKCEKYSHHMFVDFVTTFLWPFNVTYSNTLTWLACLRIRIYWSYSLFISFLTMAVPIIALQCAGVLPTRSHNPYTLIYNNSGTANNIAYTYSKYSVA